MSGVKFIPDAMGKDIHCQLTLASDEMLHMLPRAILSRIAELIAEKYVEEHYQDIVKLIDQQAIANISVAEAAAQVRKTLAEKIPDKVLEVHTKNTEVWRQGLFGGMTRLR